MKNILKKYFRKYNKNYLASYLLKEEIKYFNKAKNILDLGCGEGDFVNLDKARIIGLDRNKKSVEICRKNGLNVILSPATKLPFKKNTFDGVHCSHLIEHFLPGDAYKLLNEISRALKKEGILVLSTPVLWSGFYNDFSHIKPYNPESIERYLCINGSQKTLDDSKYKFRRISLVWRYEMFPLPGKLGILISNYLYQFGVHTFMKTGYTLVLQKIK